MNIVYFISAYKFPDQLVRLINRLLAPNVYILIHLDKKMDPVAVKQIKNAISSKLNVELIKRNYCSWGDFGLVNATNNAIIKVFEDQIPCDYFIPLSGQHYPIKPHNELIKYLSDNNGKSFMTHFSLPTSNWDGEGMDRIEKWNFSMPWSRKNFAFSKRYLKIKKYVDYLLPKRKFPQGLIPYGGDTWWVLHSDALEYVYNFLHDEYKVIHYFKYVFIPDEIIYPTILNNCSNKFDIENRLLSYRDWNQDLLTTKDYNYLLNRDEFFARKFNQEVDSNILDLLDKHMIN